MARKKNDDFEPVVTTDMTVESEQEVVIVPVDPTPAPKPAPAQHPGTETLVIDKELKKYILKLLSEGRTLRNVKLSARHQYPALADQIEKFLS